LARHDVGAVREPPLRMLPWRGASSCGPARKKFPSLICGEGPSGKQVVNAKGTVILGKAGWKEWDVGEWIRG
jgi:hypothetical protein